MNIKVKAALEVTVGILAVLSLVTGIRYILLTATAAYGFDAVVNGIFSDNVILGGVPAKVLKNIE